jgi:short-subunit dehydrogenase
MKSRTALITGASSGIGETFARMLAEDGMDLVLVARSEDKLRDLARQLAETYSRRVEVVALDLSHGGAADKLKAAVDALGLKVDLLVNNAGFGTAGAFVKQAAARERDEILLNVAAVVDLCHAFVPAMVERGQGGVINVASLAAFQPIPYMSVYAATKAFVLSFTYALRSEVRGKGVKVTALCPGPVDTPFFEATGKKGLRDTVPRGTMVTADKVVSDCLRGFKAVVLPGVAAKALAWTGNVVPRGWMAEITARVMAK